MDDILSQGTERSPSWRRVVAMVTIAAAVIAISIARHLPQRDVAAHRPVPIASSGPVQLAGLGSGAAALLNHDRNTSYACTPHAQVPAMLAAQAARTRLERLCSASVPVRPPVGRRGS
jgi:hypothetical protein